MMQGLVNVNPTAELPKSQTALGGTKNNSKSPTSELACTCNGNVNLQWQSDSALPLQICTEGVDGKSGQPDQNQLPFKPLLILLPAAQFLI